MSGSHAMTENIGVSESFEVVSDVKNETVSAEIHEITFGGLQEEKEQHAWNTNSVLGIKEFNRDTFQAETPSIDDEIDIKYELNDFEYNSTSDAENDHHADAILNQPLNHGSVNLEKTELNQLYLDLLQCERHCVTCQNYIRKLSEHVRATHGAFQPTRDPLDIDPLEMDRSAAIGINSEVEQEDIERMDCSEESGSGSEAETERDRDSDPDYNASADLTRKCKTVQKLGKDHKRDHSSRKEEMASHSKICNGKKPFECVECGMSFTKMFLLTRHSRTHTEERPFKCVVCSKTFTRKDNLTRHRMIHPVVRPSFKCEECGKDFTRRKDFSEHMRVHTQGRPHKCGECVKSFKSKSHLTFHRMSHTGERPYECEQCLSRFKSKQNLSVHTMIHAGERAYSCEQCGKGFTTSYKLMVHRKTHK